MKRFKKVYIEITNQCNLSCSFCPKTTRKQAFMSEELFENILVQIKGRAKFLYFHVLGEPLLHPKLQRFLELSWEYGNRVNITTNGTLLKTKGETLVSSPAVRQVNFSLHSFEANIKSGSIDEYLDGIFDFIREAEARTSMSFSLRLWNLTEQAPNEENKYILRRIEEFFKLDYKIHEKLTPINGLKLAHRVFLNQAMTFEWPVSSSKNLEENGFCYGLRDQLGFMADGSVVPCCLDSEAAILLGNIKENSLDSILEGERAQAMYNSFSNRRVVEPLCRKCSYRLRFDR